MMFQDKSGRLLTGDEVDELFEWEIEELGIHIYDATYI